MERKPRELNTTYWYGLFVPIVVSLMIVATLAVCVAVNVGEPHPLLRKIKFGGLPKLSVNSAKTY